MIRKVLKYKNKKYEFNYFTKSLRNPNIIIELLNSNGYLVLFLKDENMRTIDKLFEHILLNDYIDFDKIKKDNTYRTKRKLSLDKKILKNENLLFVSLKEQINYLNTDANIIMDCKVNNKSFDISMLIKGIGHVNLSIETIFSEIGRDIYLDSLSDNSIDGLFKISNINFDRVKIREKSIEKSKILGTLLSRMATNCYYVYKFHDDFGNTKSNTF